MKRRDFVAGAASLATGATMLSPQVALGQAGTPQAGDDYVKLKQPAPVEAPAGKIEVVEFFWYSCPHCHAFVLEAAMAVHADRAGVVRVGQAFAQRRGVQACTYRVQR